jgi:hypothetical protein
MRDKSGTKYDGFEYSVLRIINTKYNYNLAHLHLLACALQQGGFSPLVYATKWLKL